MARRVLTARAMRLLPNLAFVVTGSLLVGCSDPSAPVQDLRGEMGVLEFAAGTGEFETMPAFVERAALTVDVTPVDASASYEVVSLQPDVATATSELLVGAGRAVLRMTVRDATVGDATFEVRRAGAVVDRVTYRFRRPDRIVPRLACSRGQSYVDAVDVEDGFTSEVGDLLLPQVHAYAGSERLATGAGTWWTVTSEASDVVAEADGRLTAQRAGEARLVFTSVTGLAKTVRVVTR